MIYFAITFIITFLSTYNIGLSAAIQNYNNNNNEISIWPLPYDIKKIKSNKYDNNDVIITIGHNFQFNFINDGENSNDDDEMLMKAFQRYEKLMNIKDLKNYGTLKSCDIIINNYHVDYSLSTSIIGADESYSVVLTEVIECSITANTIWGILRGLETFTHLLKRNINLNQLELIDSSYANIIIKDQPRFKHRGILIDTARHYLSIDTIKHVIDSLVINKFNVLHWHAVDAESFPLETPSEPTMSRGAFSSDMTYSMTDLTELKAYAFERGVEIILEIDVPGHAGGWIKGKPEIMAQCLEKYTNINNYALNPTLNETYVTIENILYDTMKAFNGANYLHLGGDEVVYGCWAADKEIVSYMAQHNIFSYEALLNYFIQRLQSIILNINTNSIHTLSSSSSSSSSPSSSTTTTSSIISTIFWEEVYTNNCQINDKLNTIFQVWTDSNIVNEITAAGYHIIASPSNYWYLNTGSNTWTHIYSYNPTMNLNNSYQKNLVIGGELPLWGEYVDNNNIITSMYPRACAGAERLWSNESVTNIDDAVDRLFIQRCRMINRGFNMGPVQPGGYCSEIYV